MKQNLIFTLEVVAAGLILTSAIYVSVLADALMEYVL